MKRTDKAEMKFTGWKELLQKREPPELWMQHGKCDRILAVIA